MWKKLKELIATIYPELIKSISITNKIYIELEKTLKVY